MRAPSVGERTQLPRQVSLEVHGKGDAFLVADKGRSFDVVLYRYDALRAYASAILFAEFMNILLSEPTPLINASLGDLLPQRDDFTTAWLDDLHF
jgi:hypothetical protein